MNIYQKIDRYLRQKIINILLMIGRGRIMAVNENKSKNLQKLQVAFLAGELINGLDLFQQYGFSSSPLPGAECVAVFRAGDRSQGVVIATEDRRYRIVTKGGETAIYGKGGQYILLKNDEDIEIGCKKYSRKTDSEEIEVETNQDITGKGSLNISFDTNASIEGKVKVEIKSNAQVDVIAPQVNLGGINRNKVATVGDSVQVDPGTHVGTITSGSDVVKAI